jgi:SOS-response transcriptional repressor LexA
MTPEEIRARMAALGLSVRELAERAGMDENKLTKSLGKTRRKITVEEMEGIKAALSAGAGGVEHQPIGSIPIIGQVAAGNWRQAVQRSMVAMPRPDPSIPPQAFALKIEGDSMDLLVEEGGVVVVDPQDKDLFEGRYYVITNGDGEATFKQYKSNPARLVPCSSNPAHKEIAIGSNFEIVGRVIWRASRM